MIAVGLLILSAVIGIVARAFALPLAKAVVKAWVRFYTAFVPPDSRERRRSEVFSDMEEQIRSCLKENYRPYEIAPKLIYRWVTGLINDVAWCAPYTPSALANKATKLSQSLWALRKSKMAIPAIAVFGFMNYAYLSSDGERTLTLWLGINAMTTAMVVLLSQQQKVWARRILYAIIGMAGISVLGFMAWYFGPSKLYEMIQLPMFQGFLIVMAAIGLGMVVADKPIRIRLFKARWRYVIICWLLITAVSLVASIVLAGSVTPLLSALAVVAGLVASLFLFGGVTVLIATAFWYICLRGSVAGLRAVAAGLQRIK